MNVNVYDFLMGVIVSISLLFFVLFYHIKLYKNHVFLKVWLLATGLVIIGFIISLLSSNSNLSMIAIMISNLLLIASQVVYYISLKSFFENNMKLSNMKLNLVSIFFTFFAVFSNNTHIRMFSTSLVLIIFSALSINLLYSHRSKELFKSITFLIAIYWSNILFWIFRVLFILLELPSNPNLYSFIVLLTDLSALLPSVLGSFGIIVLTNQHISSLLEKEKQNYKIIALSTASWEAWFDVDGSLKWTNDMIHNITGYTSEEASNFDDIFKTIISIDKVGVFTQEFKNILEKTSSGENEFLINHTILGEKWILVSWRKIYDIDDKFIGYRCSTIDITEQKNAEFEATKLAKKLKHEKEIAEKNSLVDSMTGLANRRYLEERIAYEHARMNRNWSSLSIVMLDVDFFKLYNDTYGHVQGDICLKRIATVLKSSIKRQTDLVARYGGEEFVVLLPDTDKDSASILADNIKNSIENLKIEHSASAISNFVTVSIGVATFTKDCSAECDELIEKADFALYEAKSYGRNCVSHI